LPETVATIRRADQAGVQSVWLTSGGFGPDSLTTLAVAGTATTQILLGTSIAVTFSRHPIAMIQQAIAIDQAAPGRFRLGIGTSHRPTIEGAYGLPFQRPLEQLREYAMVLEQAFHGGQLDFAGTRFKVHGRVPNAPVIPVYLSALRPASYELAGEVADGAISWVSPSAFLGDVAKPALLAGAARRRAGAHPRLVGHAFGLVSEDEAAVTQLGRERLVGYTRLTFYQEMFAAAGYPEARNGVVSDELVEDLVLTGNEQKVTQGIRRFLDRGCEEIILSLLPAGADPEASFDRTLRLLGQRNF
jgi:F420-dependent oxidoreductase-like protein